MTKKAKAKAQIRETVDALALALVERGHRWSPELRRAYERAIRVLR